MGLKAFSDMGIEYCTKPNKAQSKKSSRAYSDNSYFDDVECKDNSGEKSFAKFRYLGENKSSVNLFYFNVSKSYFFVLNRCKIKDNSNGVEINQEHNKASSSQGNKIAVEGPCFQQIRGGEKSQKEERNSQGDVALKVWHDLNQFGISSRGKDNMFEEAIRNMEARDLEGMKARKEKTSLLK